MDASQYKDYVLFMLFIKYISDKYADSDDLEPLVSIPSGASFKDMLELRGKDDIGDKINIQVIQPLIESNSRLARSDFPDFNDPNKLGEGKDMIERLTNLINIFNDPKLDFSKNRAEHDDILGDAYEYLMRHFAQESGKSKGQFYTPAEVSRIMAKVIGIDSRSTVASTTAYDPTCGSGSLLLKVAAESRKQITLEGQEKDVTTAGLARMNMILHDFPTATIMSGNTLATPKFKEGEALRTYDYVVANPPFSDKKWSTGLTPSSDPYQRFEWGEPPAKQGDYAYLLHIIRSMKSTGKAACILPHGVLFRGNAEAVIRRKLVQSGILKGIIGLPANLFYGTGIPACILVLDKENASARKGIYMIDASKGFIKDGNKNRLREQDIHRIVDTFQKQEVIEKYSRLVPFDEISSEKNDYNLNLPRYIDSAEEEDIQDLEGHIKGGIPQRDLDALADYWEVLRSIRQKLFKSAGRPAYSLPQVPVEKIKATILDDGEFSTYKESVINVFNAWLKETVPLLEAFDETHTPKELIYQISESLLSVYKPVSLLKEYDVYQHLMNYWFETMQDDCYLISVDGWKAETRRVYEEVKSGKNKGKKKDKGWICDLIPKEYIINRYFNSEQETINNHLAQIDTIRANLEELKEEQGGDDDILKDVSSKSDAQEALASAQITAWNEDDKQACSQYTVLTDEIEESKSHLSALTDHAYLLTLKNNKGKLTLKAIKDRTAVSTDPEEKKILQAYIDEDQTIKAKTKQAADLLKAEEKYLFSQLDADSLPEHYADVKIASDFINLLEREGDLKGKVKILEKELDTKAYNKYPELSIEEIKVLVVHDKWINSLTESILSEVDKVSQTLTSRIRLLIERYESPLPSLMDSVEELSSRVEEHLLQMGASWK